MRALDRGDRLRLLPRAAWSFSCRGSRYVWSHCSSLPRMASSSNAALERQAIGTVPAGCMTWYEAFAFCVWDGGRLPTFTESNFVAAGGDEQRTFPWGEAPYDQTRAVYRDEPSGDLVPAGSRPAGVARWGVLDLGGSRIEWNLDQAKAGRLVPAPCVDCVDLFQGLSRAESDISFSQAPVSVVESRPRAQDPGARAAQAGLRCVYDVP